MNRRSILNLSLASIGGLLVPDLGMAEESDRRIYSFGTPDDLEPREWGAEVRFFDQGYTIVGYEVCRIYKSRTGTYKVIIYPECSFHSHHKLYSSIRDFTGYKMYPDIRSYPLEIPKIQYFGMYREPTIS